MLNFTLQVAHHPVFPAVILKQQVVFFFRISSSSARESVGSIMDSVGCLMLPFFVFNCSINNRSFLSSFSTEFSYFFLKISKILCLIMLFLTLIVVFYSRNSDRSRLLSQAEDFCYSHSEIDRISQRRLSPSICDPQTRVRRAEKPPGHFHL